MNREYSVIIAESGKQARGSRKLSALFENQSAVPAQILTGAGAPFTVLNSLLPGVRTEFVWVLSEDALPSDERTAEELLLAFSAPDVSAAYSRQIAEEGRFGISEAFQVAFFPAEDALKEEKDIYFHGMETFFLSHVSCMYRTEDIRALLPFEPFSKGFPEHIAAADLIHLGKKIAYRAGSRVTYLHSLTPLSALHEGFDYGVMQKRNIQAFGLYVIDDKSYDVIRQNLSQIYRRAFGTAASLLSEHGAFLKLPGAFLVYLGLKYGNKLGRRYHRLPAFVNRALGSDKAYFL